MNSRSASMVAGILVILSLVVEILMPTSLFELIPAKSGQPAKISVSFFAIYNTFAFLWYFIAYYTDHDIRDDWLWQKWLAKSLLLIGNFVLIIRSVVVDGLESVDVASVLSLLGFLAAIHLLPEKEK